MGSYLSSEAVALYCAKPSQSEENTTTSEMPLIYPKSVPMLGSINEGDGNNDDSSTSLAAGGKEGRKKEGDDADVKKKQKPKWLKI